MDANALECLRKAEINVIAAIAVVADDLRSEEIDVGTVEHRRDVDALAELYKVSDKMTKIRKKYLGEVIQE